MKKIVNLNFTPDKDFIEVGSVLGAFSVLITMAADGLRKETFSKPMIKRVASYAAGYSVVVAASYVLGVVSNSYIRKIAEPEDDEVRNLVGMSVLDRYTGTYSGGKWTFWPDDGNVPKQISEDDVTCGRAWSILKLWREKGEAQFGIGDTESEAKADYLTHKYSVEKKYGKQTQIADLSAELEKAIKARYGNDDDELPTGEFTGGEPIDE